MDYSIEKVSFASGKSPRESCAADVYFNPTAKSQPFVAMAHGFGAERTWKLPDFAHKFAEAGIGVLLFDYRNFGDSPGDVRQWVSPSRHREDYHAALAYLRARPGVNADRIGLWGASLSGGNALMVAAEDGKISALSCLVPLFDSWAVMAKMPKVGLIPVALMALADGAASLFGQSVDMQLAGDPGEFAFLTFPGWKEGILNSVPAGSSWQNKLPARIALELPFHRPILSASQVKCPTLIQYGKRDEGIPVESVLDTAKQIDQVEVEEYSMGHIQPFKEPWFSKIAARQVEFFLKTLKDV
jgi:uncharacterized protein